MDAKIQLAARDGRLIEKNADGSLDQQEVEYSCENTLLYDMSKEDIIKNRLYPFIPYYIARYEKLIKDESADISIVLEELQYLYDYVMKWIEPGDITNDEANDLKESGRWLIEHIADGNTNQERMVDQMGGRIIITTTQKLLMDKWAEGRKEGRKEGEEERKALEEENARLKAQLAEAGITIEQ